MNTNDRANGCYCPSDCGCHRGRPYCGCVKHTGYRFTVHDETHIIRRVQWKVDQYRRQRVEWNDAYETLTVRDAIGRIGCTSYDLRDTEIAWIVDTVRTIALDLFPGSGYAWTAIFHPERIAAGVVGGAQ